MRVERLPASFWWLFVPLALVAVLPLWLAGPPPLTDLPQHEAQVSVLRHWHDSDCGYPALYEIRWFTPYWFAYALAWALSWVVGVTAAFQLLLSLAVVAIPFSTARLVHQLGGEPAWALLALPLAYGMPTSWGFVTFVVAVPLVIALLGPAFRYARAPTPGAGARLGLLLAGLFVVHVLALAFAGVVVAGVIAAATRRLRDLPSRLAPLALALPLPLAWAWQAARTDGVAPARILHLGGFERLRELPVLLTAIPSAALATLALALVAASLFAARPRWARERERWVPLALVAAIVLLAPNFAFGTAYLAPRYAIFLLPALLVALDRDGATGLGGFRRAQLAAVALALLGVVAFRFHGMAREGAGLAELLETAPAGGRLLYLGYDRGSGYSPEAPFVHSGMRYAVDRCGVAERSFARNFQQPVRYLPGTAPPLPDMIEYAPYRFRWDRHGGADYDLFLVRAKERPDVTRLAGAEGRLELLAQSGRWWLYRDAQRKTRVFTAPGSTRGGGP